MNSAADIGWHSKAEPFPAPKKNKDGQEETKQGRSIYQEQKYWVLSGDNTDRNFGYEAFARVSRLDLYHLQFGLLRKTFIHHGLKE